MDFAFRICFRICWISGAAAHLSPISLYIHTCTLSPESKFRQLRLQDFSSKTIKLILSNGHLIRYDSWSNTTAGGKNLSKCFCRNFVEKSSKNVDKMRWSQNGSSYTYLQLAVLKYRNVWNTCQYGKCIILYIVLYFFCIMFCQILVRVLQNPRHTLRFSMPQKKFDIWFISDRHGPLNLYIYRHICLLLINLPFRCEKLCSGRQLHVGAPSRTQSFLDSMLGCNSSSSHWSKYN